MKTVIAVITAGVLFASAVNAAEEKKDPVDEALSGIGTFSADVAITTDYAFRGISQTNEGPALQGGFGWSKGFEIADKRKLEFFANIWGSNVDFSDGDQAHLELDYSGGIRTEISGVSLEALAIYYSYPQARGNLDYDFVEAGFGVGYDFKVVSVGTSVMWSPDFFGGIGDAYYISGDVGVPLPLKFSLDGHFGASIFSKASAEDYLDWSIGISRQVLGIDLSLAYVDSDLSRLDCGGEKKLCDSRIIFTVAKSF